MSLIKTASVLLISFILVTPAFAQTTDSTPPSGQNKPWQPSQEQQKHEQDWKEHRDERRAEREERREERREEHREERREEQRAESQEHHEGQEGVPHQQNGNSQKSETTGPGIMQPGTASNLKPMPQG